MITPTSALNLYCDAFGRRASDELAELFADDAVFDLPLHKGRISGAGAIVRMLRAALLGLKNIRIELVHVIESGSSVCAEGVFYADQVGVAPHVDGSPQRLDFKFVVVVELITRRSPYWDGSVEAGVVDFMVYNHTYFTRLRGSPD